MNSVNVVFKGNKIKISVGDKINRLTILNIFKDKNVYCVKCVCNCGTIIDRVVLRSLLSENTKSCGCLKRDLIISRNFKHGFKTRRGCSRLYGIWSDMRRRCSNPNRRGAKNYCEKE